MTHGKKGPYESPRLKSYSLSSTPQTLMLNPKPKMIMKARCKSHKHIETCSLHTILNPYQVVVMPSTLHLLPSVWTINPAESLYGHAPTSPIMGTLKKSISNPEAYIPSLAPINPLQGPVVLRIPYTLNPKPVFLDPKAPRCAANCRNRRSRQCGRARLAKFIGFRVWSLGLGLGF